MKEKIKNFYKKNFVILIMSFSVLLVIALVALVVQVNKAKAEVENAKIVLQGMKEQNIELEKQVLALFDDKQEFLAKDVTKEQVNMENSTPLFTNVPEGKLYEEVEAALADRYKINELIVKAQYYFDYQDKTNALFTQRVLNGSDVAKDLVIRKDLLSEDLAFVDDLFEQTPFNEKVKGLVNIAKTQLEDLASARKAVQESEKDKENREKNDSAFVAVEKIKNSELKNELTDKLNAIKSELDAKEADNAEQERLAQEQVLKQALNPNQQVNWTTPNTNPSNPDAPQGVTSDEVETTPPSQPTNEGQAAPPVVVTPPPAPTLTPPPVQEFRCMGWVKNPAGVIIASKIFNSYDEAEAWASNELWNYIWEEDGDKYSFGISPA